MLVGDAVTNEVVDEDAEDVVNETLNTEEVCAEVVGIATVLVATGARMGIATPCDSVYVSNHWMEQE